MKKFLSGHGLALVAALLFVSHSQAQVPVTAVAPSLVVQDPATALKGQEGLNATLWVQKAAEAKFAARQAYRLATRQLDAALRDKKWSAAIEQTGSFRKLPPAIILDIDETVLDNSAYQARLVRDDLPYSGTSWAQWVAQSNAPVISGADKFLAYAARKGVQIFYVSNRGVAEEEATRKNLLRLGLPVQGPEDHILMNGEMVDWTSDKMTRRSYVAQKYRILLLFGDDLNDFVTAKPRTLQERLELLETYDSYLGERWILLSNPLYGSWEGALLEYRIDLTRDEALRRKYGALETLEPRVEVPVPAVVTPPATR
jgi:5'-nucleotidase (lipoprotein e(P4) family)